MKKLWLCGFTVLSTMLFAKLAQAQVFPAAPTVPVVHIMGAPQFWTSVAAGIVLAIGLQTVLMAISVATGLSFTPDLRKMAAKRKAASMSRDDRHFLFDRDEEDEDEKHLKDHGATSLMVANNFGIWATITTSVALFLASFLAVKLGMVNVDEQGVIIALVIWAAFFVIITYLEWKSVRSLTGGIIYLFRTGLNAGNDMLQMTFGKSQERRAEDIGRRTIRGVYEEMSEIAHKERIDKKLHKYITALAPKMPDYKRIHDDLVDILKQIKVEEKVTVNEEDVTRILSLKLAKDHKYMNRENAQKLQETVRKAARKARGEEDKAERIFVAAETLAPIPDEEAHALREKLEKALKGTGRSEIDPENLRRDIEKIIADPKSSVEIIRARLAMVNRDTIRSLLMQNRNIDEERADRILEKAYTVIDRLKEKYAPEESDDFSMEGNYDVSGKLPVRAEKKIASYFESLHRPELNYEEIKADVEDIMHDPQIAPRVLKSRLAQMDRGTLQAILESNSHIPHEQAERLIEHIMSARDTITETIDKIQEKAVVQYERARRRTILTAEHAREAAMAAAWWIVIAAVISALSASVGGWLATTTL
jgi:hypothetical protein